MLAWFRSGVNRRWASSASLSCRDKSPSFVVWETVKWCRAEPQAAMLCYTACYAAAEGYCEARTKRYLRK